MLEKVGDRAKRGLQWKGGPALEIKKKNLHYGLCNQCYSGALLVNKISLVFLQSVKVILTLFFMPTILFTNIDADLCNSSENLKEISRSCTCVSRLTLTNLRKPRREHFPFVHNDNIILAQTS